MNISVFIGRGTKHNFPASRNFCGNSQHQYRREKRSRSTGNIKPHLFDTYRLLPASYSFHCFYLFANEALGRVESFNIPFSQRNGRFQLVADQSFGFLYFFGSHSESRQSHLIKSRLIFQNSFITFRSYLIYNSTNCIEQALRIQSRTLQKFCPLFFGGIFD